MMRNALDLYDQLIPYDRQKTSDFIKLHLDGIEDSDIVLETMLNDFELTVFEDMKVDDFIESLILIGAQNIQNDPVFDQVATRILLTKMHKSSLTEYKNAKDSDFDRAYRESFVEYIKWGVEEKLLDQRMVDSFNLYELALALTPSRDDIYNYIGLFTLGKRYSVKNRDQTFRETPQYTMMRVGMGMALKESEPNKWAKVFYEKLSKREYAAGGSTMIGSGTTWPTLANCFLLDTEDDITHIFENVANIAKIAKGTGGIGLCVTKLRAEGSPVHTNNTFSSGPIPFMKIMDATVTAIARAGKKKGAIALYMENWHYNFHDFLDLKQNAGDDYRRTRTANTAVYISDEFMKRVMNGDDWYMFDPAEVRDLTELYGSEFSKRYNEYCKMAENGEIKMWSKTPAKEQMKKILVALQTTSHPWLTWKDTINLRALNNNTGTIHNSNLCTEVCLPQDRENIAVCNLLYVNLIPHVDTSRIKWGGNVDQNLNAFDWKKFKESIKVGMRHLDNLIDVGIAPVPEAKHSDEKNRAVGLGIMGFSEFLELFGYAYDTEEAYYLIDRVMEFLSYVAIDSSSDLAAERGSYPNYQGSMWSKGFVPYDTMQKVEDDRNYELKQNRDHKLDWDKLREKVQVGMRNATCMMIAPNGNSSLVAGTSPGIDPRFALIFSRTTMNGKFLDINENLVRELKKLDIWADVREELLEKQGDIESIEAIPDEIKQVYKTCFQISPYAFIEVASRAQKWVDQSMSRNMYLDSRDIDEMVDVYTEAWKRGLKTTYYLHMKPRHTAEQSTIKVNKGKKLGKAGFGSTASVAKSEAEVGVPAESIAKSSVGEVPIDGVEAKPAAKSNSAKRGFGFAAGVDRK